MWRPYDNRGVIRSRFLLGMRIIKLALAVSTMVCLAVTSTLARDSETTRDSSSSKSKTSSKSKAGRSKTATAKRKAAAAARRAAAKKTSSKRKQAKAARSTGEIDVRGANSEDLPPEELPVSETQLQGQPQPPQEVDDEDLLPEP